MSPSCTIDNITVNVNEIDLEITNEGYEIVGKIDSLDQIQPLIEYLDTRTDSNNTVRLIRIQDNQHEKGERCNSIFDSVGYDFQQEGCIRFRIIIREVPILGT